LEEKKKTPTEKGRREENKCIPSPIEDHLRWRKTLA